MRQFAVISAVLILVGCTSLQQSESQLEEAAVVTIAADYDQVWSAALNVLFESRLEIVHQNKALGLILAESGLSWLSYGENVALRIQHQGNGQIALQVVSTPALRTNITATDWRQYIVDHIMANTAEAMIISAARP